MFFNFMFKKIFLIFNYKLLNDKSYNVFLIKGVIINGGKLVLEIS